MWCMRLFCFLITTIILVNVSNGQGPYSDAGFLGSTFAYEPRNLQAGGTTSRNVTITILEPREVLPVGEFYVGGSSIIFDNLDPGNYSTYAVEFGYPGTGKLNGTFHNLTLKAADSYGGAGGFGTYALASGRAPTVLELGGTANAISFLITAWDDDNIVEFYNDEEILLTWHAKDYTSAVRSHNAGYFGNPWTRENPNEPYVYTNFYFNSDYSNKVKFTGPAGSGRGFEIDNVSAGVFYCQNGFVIAGGPKYCAKDPNSPPTET